MPSRSCGSCIGLGILVSALVHGLGLYLLLQRQPPTLEAGVEAGLELELALFAPTGGGLTPVTPSAPDTAPAPPAPPAAEAAPLAEPEPAPVRPAEQPPPPRAMPEPLVSPSVVEDKPTPPPEAKPKPIAPSQAKPKSTPQPKPTPAPKTTLKPTSKPAEPSPPRPPQSTTEAKRTPQADQVPLDASPGPGKGPTRPAAGASGGEKGTSVRGTNTEGAFLAELQRAIIRHQRYPEQARREGRQGSATLSFVLLGDGRFDQVRVARSSGDRDLDQAAIESLHRLGRFRPIPLELGRDRWPLSVVIRFNLQ